jgi:thioredoxin reductase
MRENFDVAIVGGGPAGLSAALVLGRSRRRVVVIDDRKPRNYAAKAINGFLALDGLSPTALLDRGREQCASYGVKIIDAKVVSGNRTELKAGSRFELKLENGETLQASKLLLATGVKDELPQIAGFDDFYGVTVHHCPYCDGWEHRDERLIAYGQEKSAVKLAIMLLAWSDHVTCCTDGALVSPDDLAQLERNGIDHRNETVLELKGVDGVLEEIRFNAGNPLACDAMFFATGQGQRSELPRMLGCDYNKEGLVDVKGKQGSGVRGLFLAGDADGDVQFAIVAAAEGAIAATAINAELQEENHP